MRDNLRAFSVNGKSQATRTPPEIQTYLADGQVPPASGELMHLARLVTIGELSACLAHEFFNPLMTIRGYSKFIDEAMPKDDPQRTSLEAILRASRHLEEMARRMLDFSRNHEPRMQVCNAGELIADAQQFMKPYFNDRNVDVGVHIEPSLPRIEADRSQIVQAMVNLIQNAVDAMAESSLRALRLSAVSVGGKVQIGVEDTGCGIAESDLGRVFNPFFTTKGERGTGLGLYITKRIIDEHGASIAIQTSGSGTKFLITFEAVRRE